MAGFMRSVVWQFWAAVLLLSDMLVHLVRAARLEENSKYQACVASGCTSLALGRVSLSGTIPTEISTLTSLGFLNLLGNSLSGTIPTEIGEMTLLRDLRLFGNSLSGTIPTVLGEMTSLTRILLNDNSLSGNIPTEMGELTSLGSLNLIDNAGLCGDVLSVGTVGTSYDTSGTALGTACPTVSPTGSPTAPTVSPTTMSPTVLPTVSPSMHPTSMHPTSMHPTTMSPTTMSPTVSPSVSPSMHPTTASPTLLSMSPTLSPSFAPSTSPTKPFIKTVLADGQLIVDADLSQLKVHGLTPMTVEVDTSTNLTINATQEIDEVWEPDSTDSTSASVGPVPSLFLLMCVVGLAVTAMVTIKRRRAASADRSTHEDMPLFTDYPRYS